jgi:glycine/D-amino acid oxidase-like deaminating enzyme/nitrite reductase/ring-hydroxylating ferredoxin subunit
MGSLHERNISLWVGTTPETDYPPLPGDAEADVAVLGAGIAGLNTAWLLKQAGLRVIVVEAARVASGTTGYTTAKITSLHGLIYDHLSKELGDERARIYGEANQAGIERIAANVREGKIDCDFERKDAYTYTGDKGMTSQIVAEVEAARRLGLPASFEETLDLPFPVAGAVRLTDQAQFHPRKYCLGLARLIDGDGSHVYEKTRATDVDAGSPCTVATEHGTIRADHVVVATQIPFLFRGEFWAKTYPSRSYVVAKQVDGPVPSGMYLGVGQPGLSVRTQPGEGGTYLIVGGGNHRVGEEPDTRTCYEDLEKSAKEHFGWEVVDYRWSAQDYMPADHVPYIGRLTSGSDRVYVATGFQKWGMTTSAVAGMIISDAILGRDNPWASLFDATRLDLLHSAKGLISANADVVKRFVGDRFDALSAPTVETLKPGEGGVVRAGERVVAAFRDAAGDVHAVSPVCAHLGCYVTWNTAEETWDCPCHGSRYDIDGHAIQGPTVKDLAVKPISGEAAIQPSSAEETGTSTST